MAGSSTAKEEGQPILTEIGVIFVLDCVCALQFAAFGLHCLDMFGQASVYIF